MPNLLPGELDQISTLASGDIFIVQPAAGPPCEYATATQLTAFVFSTGIALTGQTTATGATAGAVTLATGFAGYLVVSINGTSVKLPYLNT
jgi:hypothetical protein